MTGLHGSIIGWLITTGAGLEMIAVVIGRLMIEDEIAGRVMTDDEINGCLTILGDECIKRLDLL